MVRRYAEIQIGLQRNGELILQYSAVMSYLFSAFIACHLIFSVCFFSFHFNNVQFSALFWEDLTLVYTLCLHHLTYIHSLNFPVTYAFHFICHKPCSVSVSRPIILIPSRQCRDNRLNFECFRKKPFFPIAPLTCFNFSIEWNGIINKSHSPSCQVFL